MMFTKSRLILSLSGLLFIAGTITQANEIASPNLKVTHSLASAPMAFTENQGQWATRVGLNPKISINGSALKNSPKGAPQLLLNDIGTELTTLRNAV